MASAEAIPLGKATIGPSKWKDSSVKVIKLAQNVIQTSDKQCDIGRSLDPVPHLREILAELGNDHAYKYIRQVRQVVAYLRQSWMDTNEEIKVLSRSKEAVEKSLDHIRKDIKVNEDSSNNRNSRPDREKDRDGADDLLAAERQHLLNLKRTLEAQLRAVQNQLFDLDNTRRRLAGVIRERSRVLDLVCHTLAALKNIPEFKSGTVKRSAAGDRVLGSVQRPLNEEAVPDPLGPYTPETDKALRDAAAARERSAQLRKETRDTIERCDSLQRTAYRAVNDGFTQKIAETVTLKQHLQVSSGETRHATNRAQRWYDATERARGYSMGPMFYRDFQTHERLDRPLIRVFQRHPGTQLPEAQEIIKGGEGLLDSLATTSRNIGLLHLTQKRLRSDILDKSRAASIDSSILRMRRQKSDHRWVGSQPFAHP